VKSLDPGHLDALRLTADHGSTLKALGEYRGKQELYRRQTPQILDVLKQAAVVESAESSNRLEGITASPERIEALVLRSTAPRDRSEQEIAGYRDALNLLHESAREMAFSVNVILQLHTMLFRYAPSPGGRWKMAQNEIVERNPDGSVNYGPRASCRCHGARQPASPRSSSRAKAMSVSRMRFGGFRFRRQKDCKSTKTINSVSVKFVMAVASCL